MKGFDIGTGANCIYPLLGASLLGWSFVGSGIYCFWQCSWIFVFSLFCIIMLLVKNKIKF